VGPTCGQGMGPPSGVPRVRVGPTVASSRRPFAYLFPQENNPKCLSQYPRKVPETPQPSTLAREGPEPLPGTLPERGIVTEGFYIAMPASGVMRE
jgi:hypothetical protein